MLQYAFEVAKEVPVCHSGPYLPTLSTVHNVTNNKSHATANVWEAHIYIIYTTANATHETVFISVSINNVTSFSRSQSAAAAFHRRNQFTSLDKHDYMYVKAWSGVEYWRYTPISRSSTVSRKANSFIISLSMLDCTRWLLRLKTTCSKHGIKTLYSKTAKCSTASYCHTGMFSIKQHYHNYHVVAIIKH